MQGTSGMAYLFSVLLYGNPGSNMAPWRAYEYVQGSCDGITFRIKKQRLIFNSCQVRECRKGKTTVDSHYSQIFYLQICLLSKIYLKSPNQYLWCFQTFTDICRDAKVLSHRQPCSQMRPNKGFSAFLFQHSYHKETSFLQSIQYHIFHIFIGVFYWWHFLLVVLLSNLAPNPSAEMLSCVSKHKKAAMCLMEKIHVLDELRSGMTFSAPSCELNVHEPKLSNKVSKQKHSLNKITY